MKYFLVLSVLLLSCNKHSQQTTIPVETTAIVYYTGPIETDGCDWETFINNMYYHPDSLPDSVKQNGLHVLVTYSKINDKFICGIGATAFDIIHIKSVKPQ